MKAKAIYTSHMLCSKLKVVQHLVHLIVVLYNFVKLTPSKFPQGGEENNQRQMKYVVLYCHLSSNRRDVLLAVMKTDHHTI